MQTTGRKTLTKPPNFILSPRAKIPTVSLYGWNFGNSLLSAVTVDGWAYCIDSLTISLSVLTHYQTVLDRQTDGQWTDISTTAKSALCNATRSKNDREYLCENTV